MKHEPNAGRIARGVTVALAVTVGLGACSSDDETVTTTDDGGNQAARTAVIQTDDGPIRGKISDGVREFLGIPFAAPPTGDLRWRPPQSPAPWEQTKDTVAFGDTCAQTATLGVFAAQSRSEDCLYLNVFAPRNVAEDEALPVMVWIYGGGLVAGESDDYDGSKLVKQGDVLVVTLNYRLNIFGFLSLPALDDEGHTFGNYGFMDQQFALQWVQDNIAAFGGDPDNVTLFGESSGGTGVLANMISPAAKGLFDYAILESGAGTFTSDLATAEAKGAEFADAVGCGNGAASQIASCLRSLSVEEIQTMAPQFQNSFTVPVDGTILTQPLNAALQAGNFNRVPVINGTNEDENRFFVAITEQATGEALTGDAYEQRIRNQFGDDAEAVLARYPLSDYDSPSEAYAAVEEDAVNFVCPALREDRWLAAFVPVYVYQFADRTAPVYAPPVSFAYGAYHTSEIQYLFPLYHGGQGTPHPLNEAQNALSDDMVSYWTTFARSGDPNSAATPQWPRYTDDDGEYQSFDLPRPDTRSFADLRAEHHCDFWDGLRK